MLLSFCSKEPSLKVGEVTYRLFDRVGVKINVDKSSTENKFLSFSIISKKVLIEDRDRILFHCFLKGSNINPRLQTTLKVMFTLWYRILRVIVWIESEQQRPGTAASRLHASKASIWMVKFWRLQTNSKTEPPRTAQLKELCHGIYENVNGANCHQIKWNMKITARILKASLFVEVRQHDTFLHQMEVQKKIRAPDGIRTHDPLWE